MVEDEHFKRRLHAYIAVFSLPIGIVLMAIAAAFIDPFDEYKKILTSGVSGTLTNDILKYWMVFCLIPFAFQGLFWRRFLSRKLSAIAGSISTFIFPPGWLWLPYFWRDLYRVNRLERMGLRQALVFQFAFPFCTTEQISRRLRMLDNEGLVMAYHLPDHTPAANGVR